MEFKLVRIKDCHRGQLLGKEAGKEAVAQEVLY